MPSIPSAALAPIAPYVAAPLWTGLYFGAHAGGGQSDKKFIDNFPTYDGELDAAPTLSGPLGGLQAGYNHQFNWLVIGIEGDFSWAGVREKQFSCFFFGDQICSAESQWFASVTGRIGAAVGPTFLYVKGGAAWVRDEYTDVATCSGTQRVFRAGIYANCDSLYVGQETRDGWTVGARHRIPHQPELVTQGSNTTTWILARSRFGSSMRTVTSSRRRFTSAPTSSR